MIQRILIQIFLFLLPFMLFGLYRWALRERYLSGKKPWPIKLLFGMGLTLTIGFWFAFIFLDRTGQNVCYRPSQMRDGVFLPGETYPCDKTQNTLANTPARGEGTDAPLKLSDPKKGGSGAQQP